MKASNNKLVKLLSTGFYVGYAPVLPGTAGTLVGVLIYLLIGKFAFLHLLLLLILLLTAPWVCSQAEEIFGEKDSHKIVLDEIVGYLMSVYLLPFSWKYIIAAFIIFRFLDMLKPGLIKIADRTKSGVGIVLDDVVAGLLTNIILQIIHHL